MPKFLRDEYLKNLTINEETLISVNDLLIERAVSTNREIEASENIERDDLIFLTYIIRFDNRGYKLTDFNDVLKYYSQATKVERVIFILDSARSERTNRMYGTHFEIRFDSNDPKNSHIQSASDDRDTVDAVFNGIKDIINKVKNKNGYIRNTWSDLLIQILGVSVGFIISLIAGLKISPYINVENAFTITFLFTFLIFSNAWGFINNQILRFVDYSFSNIRFSRKNKHTIHWLIQTLVGGIFLTITLLIVSTIFEWVGKLLGQFIDT